MKISTECFAVLHVINLRPEGGKKKRYRNQSPTLRQLGLPSHPDSLPRLLSGSLNSLYWFLTQHIPNHLKVWPLTPWGWWQMPGKSQMEMLWVRGNGMFARALDDSVSPPATLKTIPPPRDLQTQPGWIPTLSWPWSYPSHSSSW